MNDYEHIKPVTLSEAIRTITDAARAGYEPMLYINGLFIPVDTGPAPEEVKQC